MILWPESLPSIPLLEGYAEEPEDLAIRQKPDIGAPLTRSRATKYGTTFKFSLALTSDQVDTLQDFYWTTLVSGVLPFEWEHPRKGTSGEFLFNEAPSWTRSNGSQGYFASLNIYLKP